MKLNLPDGKFKCPECGQPMVLRKSVKFPAPFYGCSQFPKCRGSHGCHPDGTPLGFPANKETKEWRKRAHEVFDVLWKSEDLRLSRNSAYKLISKKLGLAEVHIGGADIELCKRIIAASEDVIKKI